MTAGLKPLRTRRLLMVVLSTTAGAVHVIGFLAIGGCLPLTSSAT
jgi:hypothetical protein